MNLAICLPTRSGGIPGASYVAITTAISAGTAYWQREYPGSAIAVFGSHRGHAGRTRNHILRQVLDHDVKFEWTLWLDDDALPPPQILERLIAHKKDMVTPVFRKRVPDEEAKYPCPAVLRMEDGELILPELDIPGLTRITWNGMHCALIHADVFRRVERMLGLGSNCFQMTDEMSEDVFFFQCAEKAGCELWLDRGCVVDHVTVTTVENLRRM